jgi:PAS domain S-box-containing protein
MNLGSTLFAPASEWTSSLTPFDNIDRWRSLFERSTLGVAMIDSGFRFLVANPAFLTMFGYSSEELQQLSFLDICIDEARDDCRVPLRELREGVRLQYEIETQHRRKDGTSLPVNTYFSAVSERGPNQRTLLTVTVDISARRAAEDALRAGPAFAGWIVWSQISKRPGRRSSALSARVIALRTSLRAFGQCSERIRATGRR